MGTGGTTSPSSTSRRGVLTASRLGSVAYTTVTGSIDVIGRTGSSNTLNFPVGEDVYGPFENGFGATQDRILAQLGCANTTNGYVDGGFDTHTVFSGVYYHTALFCKILHDTDRAGIHGSNGTVRHSHTTPEWHFRTIIVLDLSCSCG